MFDLFQVNLLWSCPSSGWNGTYDMERVVDGQPLYEADISTGLECGQPADGGPAVVAVQVRADPMLIANLDLAMVSVSVIDEPGSRLRL